VTNKLVNNKISAVKRGDIDLGQRLRKLREKKLQAGQKSLADLLGVSQGMISQWENGQLLPSPMALMAIGRIAGEDRDWWFQRAGARYAQVDKLHRRYKEIFEVSSKENRTILVYGSVIPAGPGSFRFVPTEAEGKMSFPGAWFEESASIVGLRIRGESMFPLISTGDIVVVDIWKRKRAALIGAIVAVSDGQGVSVKYLRKSGKRFFLVPHNPDVDNPEIEVAERERIIGRVVGWVHPPAKGLKK
jgi:SOS-response transcriptional repressor LexA